MTEVNTNRLATYVGTARDERLYGGSSGSSCRIITVRTEQREEEARPITDVTNSALRKEEKIVRLIALRKKQFSM
jgi:hypothetical protein